MSPDEARAKCPLIRLPSGSPVRCKAGRYEPGRRRERRCGSATRGTSPEQRALLEIRLKQAGLALPEVDGIPRRLPGVAAPLSFAQERLWFLEQLEPGTYNVAQNLRLTGPLKPEALRESFGHIVRRHEVFRASFPAPNGHPQQMIATELDFPLPITDLSAFPQRERELAARRLMSEHARGPFDLERGLALSDQPRSFKPGGAHPAALPTSYRLRCLVDGRAHSRAG